MVVPHCHCSKLGDFIFKTGQSEVVFRVGQTGRNCSMNGVVHGISPDKIITILVYSIMEIISIYIVY